MAADELVDDPLSLHVVYGLLSNKELAAWLGTQSLEGCYSKLRDALGDISDDGLGASEPSWLAAACVVKMWGLHDLAIDFDFDHQFYLVTNCLFMVYTVCTSPQAHTWHDEITNLSRACMS